MLEELADLGFSYVELSHGTRISLVPGILKGIEDGIVKVASVHNFCPLPVGVMGAAPNLFEPSAANRRERSMWLHNTIKTVEFANRVDCQRVVLHSGSMRFLWRHPERAMDEALERASKEGADPGDLESARQRGLKRMKRSRKAYMDRLRESYGQIAEYGKQQGVTFGIENREGFTELPLDEEMSGFLDALKEHEVFGYWHDSGHAQLKQEMGLLDHGTFLNNLRPHLVGFHLHDVSSKGRDHQVPGTGTIDWSIVAGQVRSGDVVVMEMSPRLNTEQIREGRDFLLRTIPALAQEG